MAAEDLRDLTAIVSYSHEDSGWSSDEVEHRKQHVLNLVAALRNNGIDANADLYRQNEDWTRWGPQRIAGSDFTLIVVSNAWKQAWEGTGDITKHKGVRSEASAVRSIEQNGQDELQRRCRLILLPGSHEEDIPTGLHGLVRYRINGFGTADLEELLRDLTGQPRYLRPPLGTRPIFPSATPGRPSVDVTGGEHSARGVSDAGRVVVGSPPLPASAFQAREAVLDRATRASGTVVLSQPSARVLAGTGGVGKTQIAAGLFASSAADVRAWVPASSRESVLTVYGAAAARLGVVGPDEPSEDAAQSFLEYLAGADSTWMVVLDDVRDPRDLSGLWPANGGDVIVTTQRRDAVLSDGGRTVVDVGVFTNGEAVDYLRMRIRPLSGGLPDNVLEEAEDLASDLGRLPLALAQAAAVIIDRGITCTQYRSMFADRSRSLNDLFPQDAAPDGYQKTVATTWNLAIEAADSVDPSGIARHLAAVVSVLDPGGTPESVLTGYSVKSLLTPAGRPEVSAEALRDALRALHRLSVIDHRTGADDARGVMMHALTGRAIRAGHSASSIAELVRAAADGVVEAWPEIEKDRQLAESLRSNTEVLSEINPDALWDDGGLGPHPALFRAGASLRKAGLFEQAVVYFDRLAAQCLERLGPGHPATLAARNNLAGAYHSAGRVSEAIHSSEQNFGDSVRVLGQDDPTTLASGNNLANGYQSAWRLSDAIRLGQQNLGNSVRVHGPDHPNTIISRNNLARSYEMAGQLDEAIRLYERTLADSERVLGSDHPNTLACRSNAAHAYWKAGRLDEAIRLYEPTLADLMRVLGSDHPTTLACRNNTALAYRSIGRLDDAIRLYEQTLTDSVRMLGVDHPDALTSRNNLANAYDMAGRPSEAISLYEQTLVGRVRVLGPNHPYTVATRQSLARLRDQHEAH